MLKQITDTLNRPLQDLRISVIDRCNFRCPYCMPENAALKFLNNGQWLTVQEIVRLAKIFVSLGAVKLRLTGGEPLLRPDIHKLIGGLSAIDGVQDLALTTNASLLKGHARQLKESGLKRLTVSLDALDARTFNTLSGNKGSVEQVLDGIKEAQTQGFENIKINCVVQKGVNDNKILELVKYFKDSGHILRFIEYMDVGNCNHWEKKYVVPNKEIAALINQHYPITPVQKNYFGEVAERYVLVEGQGEVGFISSISEPFCRSCTRGRLTTDGKLITCLFAQDGVDLRTPMRQGAGDSDLIELIARTWARRDDRYSELRGQASLNPAQPPKIEMFQLGG